MPGGFGLVVGRDLVSLAKAPGAVRENGDVGDLAASAWPDVCLW